MSVEFSGDFKLSIRDVDALPDTDHELRQFCVDVIGDEIYQKIKNIRILKAYSAQNIAARNVALELVQRGVDIECKVKVR